MYMLCSFNVLPDDIRNLSGCTVDTFKHRLDRYLASVPDEPQIQGYTAQRRAESNSLLDMACLAHQESRMEVLRSVDTLSRGGRAPSTVKPEDSTRTRTRTALKKATKFYFLVV